MLISIAFLGKSINAEINVNEVSHYFFNGTLSDLMLYLRFIHTPNRFKSYLQKVIINLVILKEFAILKVISKRGYSDFHLS